MEGACSFPERLSGLGRLKRQVVFNEAMPPLSLLSKKSSCFIRCPPSVGIIKFPQPHDRQAGHAKQRSEVQSSVVLRLYVFEFGAELRQE